MGFFNVLKSGEELANADTWKNMQVLGTALFTVIAFVVGFLPPEYQIPVDLQHKIVEVILAIVAVFNTYLTFATSKKVGLPGENSATRN